METCLILGASGFMGKALCKELVKYYSVKAVDIHYSTELNSYPNFTMIKQDFTQIKDFLPLLKDVDKVIHLISTTIPEERTDNLDQDVLYNVIPTLRLLDDMVKAGGKEIIFASSAGTIYGETGDHINRIKDTLSPICGYGMQKKTIEGYIEFYQRYHGLPYKIIRISNPYGMGQDINKPQGAIPIFINSFLQKKDIRIYGNGDNKRDYIYMDDLIEGFLKVIQHSSTNGIYQLCSGKEVSINEIITLIEQVGNGYFEQIIRCPARKCDVTRCCLEAKSTQEFLGWKPQTDLYNGIRNIFENMNKTI